MRTQRLAAVGVQKPPGSLPTLPSLLLPGSHSLRKAPVPTVSLDGSISRPGTENSVS